MAEQKRSTTPRSSWAPTPPVAGWRFKTIGLTGLIFGVIGGFIGWRSTGQAVATLPESLGLAMLFAPYFVVPRTKTNRVIQGFLGGVLAGILCLVILLLFATATYWPLRTDLAMTFGAFAVGTFGVSWMMTMLSNWTEKKRAQADAKRAAQAAKEVSPVDKFRRPKKEKIVRDESAKPVRVHRYNKKK